MSETAEIRNRKETSGEGEKVNPITDGVIWRGLLVYFFPILLGTFFQQLYNTADAVVVGRFVGKEALAAVGGSSSTIVNLLVGFFVGMSSGASVIISQYYGGKRKDRLSRAVHTAVLLAAVGGAVIMTVGLLGAPAALRLMNTPDDVFPAASLYLRVLFLGMIPSLLYNMGAGILRAVGDSRRPMLFLILSCLINIVLDVLFVAVLGLGVFGVALGTVLSQVLSAVFVLAVLLRTKEDYRVEPRKLALHGPTLLKIVRIGLPAGLQSAMYSISNIIIQSTVNTFGTDTMAAWTATSKIDAIYWMIMDAFGVAITTFCGQNFGAGRFDRVKKSVRVCLVMAFSSTALVVLLLYFGGPVIYPFFTDDPAVMEIGIACMRFLVPTYFTYILIAVLSGAMRGAGESVVPMLLTAGGVCGLRILWILLAVPHRPEMIFLLWSYPISWGLTSLLYLAYYCHGGWLARRKKENGFPLTEREERLLGRAGRP